MDYSCFISLFICGILTMTAVQALCPPSWNLFGRHCFLLSNHKLAFTDAINACRGLGGDIASIHSQEEHHFIRDLMRSENDDFFLGLRKQNGNWENLDNSPVDFFYWGNGEPNNAGGNENCVEMYHNRNGAWNDIPCTISFRYICRTPAVTSTESSTTRSYDPSTITSTESSTTRSYDPSTNVVTTTESYTTRSLDHSTTLLRDESTEENAVENGPSTVVDETPATGYGSATFFEPISDCRTAWTNYSGSLYCYFARPRRWVGASRFCARNGGHLLQVDDNAENEFILKSLNNLNEHLIWMGITDQYEEGDWKTDDGNFPSEYRNWQPGEPDNWSNEDCAAMSLAGTQQPGFWSDYSCCYEFAFVCKK